ncbi:MAG TPA: hypothetical protein PKD67_13170 [Ignavibacteriaceae bacterium]|nr:hypothetical protein [Ignavibacteriaceae bacterium]
MISIISLWLPIILSAVVVFFISSILHMLFKYHNSDFKKLPSEDAVRNDLRKHNILPGDYMMPYTTDNKERNSPEFKDKLSKGPVAVFTILPSSAMNMGSSLAMWFVYCLIIGIFSAYVAGRALEPGAPYLSVFRFAGATAFTSYSLALLHDSIWFKRNWTTTFKYMFDGLIYALFTGGVFGWLWPTM